MTNGKRLTRSRTDKWLAGVCGGIVYIILCMCMPEEK
ncbi:MAG: PspC domain-containing protein [Prevotella sp.]